VSPEPSGTKLNSVIEEARSKATRRRRQIFVIFTIFGAGFVCLGVIGLLGGLQAGGSRSSGDLVVGGAVGLAIGLFSIAGAVAMLLRTSWFGEWNANLTYGDRPDARWAIAPTVRDEESFACPRCKATNLEVSPNCRKCGLEL
jgi:ribosomal protein L40E